MQVRKTRQRAAIRSLLESAPHPLTVDEVKRGVADSLGRVGIATVYRSLNALREEGWLRSVEVPGEPVRYERSHKEHHHHFACSSCERLFDVSGCVDVTVMVPKNFRVDDHAVTLYGVCAECSA